MVAGHVREKKGYFYAVLNYTDAFGNRKTKWIKTGLPVKGNKKKAEKKVKEKENDDETSPWHRQPTKQVAMRLLKL